MYDFNLLENENIIIISDEALLKKSNNIKKVSVIITNYRFIILSLPEDLESFRFGRTIMHPIKKEIIFDTPIESIDRVEKGKDFDKYILKDSNYFFLDDNGIYNYINTKR